MIVERSPHVSPGDFLSPSAIRLASFVLVTFDADRRWDRASDNSRSLPGEVPATTIPSPGQSFGVYTSGKRSGQAFRA